MKEPLTIIYLKLTSGKISILQGVTALNCLQKQPASSSTLQIASRKKKSQQDPETDFPGFQQIVPSSSS